MPQLASKKIGRNDRCPCGSGKKYKDCHLLLEQAEQADLRKLRQAQDTLLPRLVEAAQGVPEVFPVAMERFWGGKFGVEQMAEIDEQEDRGAERFLIWLAFDHPLEDGRTLVETLAGDGGSLELDEYETRLLQQWQGVRLRAYQADAVLKGQGLTLRDLLDGSTYQVVDHAASRRIEVDEVMVGHLVPVAGGSANQKPTYYVAGAAAHLTEDTASKLVEFAGLYLEDLRRTHPDATWQDLIRDRSYVLNQFVISLPSEEFNPTMVDNILLQTRMALRLTGDSLAGLVGMGGKDEEQNEEQGTKNKD